MSLLQLVSFSPEVTDWQVPISIVNPDFLLNSPVTHFIHKIHETYFSKRVEPPATFPPFLVESFKLLIENGFQVSLYKLPFNHHQRTIPVKEAHSRQPHVDSTLKVTCPLHEFHRTISSLLKFEDWRDFEIDFQTILYSTLYVSKTGSNFC